MKRHFAWSLLMPVVWLSPTVGQEAVKKNAPGSNDVEVRFQDESVVRMTILQENLEVLTKYGKLTVPARDMRRIVFGLHLADGVGKKVDTLIRGLGGNSFHDREVAGKQLLALGPKAYTALVAAARSKDPEIKERAQTLVKKLREQFPAEQLQAREDDIVQTSEFTIIGRVTPPAIRARTAYFGEPEIELSQLRTIRWLAQGARAEVTVDAARFGNGQWLETDVEVNAADHVSIKAGGEVDLQPANPGTVVCGPWGINQGVGLPGGPAGGAPAGLGGRGQFNRRQGGMLLGRIGESGPMFVIGERYQGRAGSAGKLYLQIMAGPWGQSTGSYAVTINISDVPDAAP
jgi:hypothetical protein